MNKVLRIKIVGIENFENSIFSVDFTNRKNAKTNDGELYNLASRLYTHNVMAFTGTNASGKTMNLKIIDWVLNFFHNKTSSLNELNKIASFENEVTNEYTFSKPSETFSKLDFVRSILKIKKNIDNHFVIVDEIVDIKTIRNSTTNKRAYDLDKSNSSFSRESILNGNSIKLLNSRSNLNIDDKISETSITNYLFPNHELKVSYLVANNIKIDSLKKVNPIVLDYFDSAIESLIPVNFSSISNLYSLKFYNKEEKILQSNDLLRYISFGTIKGLVVYEAIKDVLRNGGYLLIDDLESNFHKSVTTDIIKLFNSFKTNPNGAVLIFATHYAELLDTLKRIDSIYITSKDNNKLSINNMSDFNIRNDKLKSDAFFNTLKGVTSKPSYDKYQERLKSIIR